MAATKKIPYRSSWESYLGCSGFCVFAFAVYGVWEAPDDLLTTAWPLMLLGLGALFSNLWLDEHYLLDFTNSELRRQLRLFVWTRELEVVGFDEIVGTCVHEMERRSSKPDWRGRKRRPSAETFYAAGFQTREGRVLAVGDRWPEPERVEPLARELAKDLNVQYLGTVAQRASGR